jgi:hypothetical protein
MWSAQLLRMRACVTTHPMGNSTTQIKSRCGRFILHQVDSIRNSSRHRMGSAPSRCTRLQTSPCSRQENLLDAVDSLNCESEPVSLFSRWECLLRKSHLHCGGAPTPSWLTSEIRQSSPPAKARYSMRPMQRLIFL